MTVRKVMGKLWIVLFILGALALVTVGCSDDTDNGANPFEVHVQATTQDTFSPQEILVDKGTTVVWTNVDTDLHSVTTDPLDPVDEGPNSDAIFQMGIPPGQSFSWIVPKNVASGTMWYYHCRFHGTPGDGHSYGSGMVGLIVVK
jgi:plastocyanin